MRAKPISFAQVLKSKGKNTHEGQAYTQSNVHNRFKLADLVEQFEEAPKEDYTLYLGPVSSGKPTSFRAMASRGSNGDQIFDSWIQRQSIVSNKQNIRMVSSRSIPQSVKDPKKAGTTSTSAERDNRQPLKSVADLVRKMQNTQSGNPYFKSNNNRQILQTSHETDSRASLRPYKQKQQTSITPPKQETQNQNPIQAIPKIAERISVQPYIQQATSIKQSRQRKPENMDDLIARTENIHLEIAEMANKMIAEQEQNKLMEESLLIDNTDPKQQNQSDKENSPSFWQKDEGKGSRWASVKNQMNIYLRKIAQQREKQTAPTPKIQVIPPQINTAKIETEHPGYSFANRDDHRDDHMQDYSIPLESIRIPQIQEIQSERLPFQNYRNYFQNSHEMWQTPIPQNPSIPSTQSINLQQTPKHDQETNRCEQYQISAKRIGSSLVFSSNPKDTPSPQDKQLPQENAHAVLSFTEEKPEIVVKIPLDYCEAAEEFQMETVDVRTEYVKNPYVQNASPSPQSYKWDRMNDIALNREVQTQKNMILLPEISKEQPYLRVCQKYNQTEQPSKVPLFIHDIIAIPKVEKGLPSFQTTNVPLSEEPMRITHKSEEKISIGQTSFDSKPLHADSIEISAPSEPPTQPAIQQFIINNPKSSGSKVSSKGSPSIFGLKKIYSSPKTTPAISQPPIITSVFTTGIEKPKIEPIQIKEHSYPRPYERCSKIQTLAYASTYGKKTKEEPKMMVEEDGEQFKFDF